MLKKTILICHLLFLFLIQAFSQSDTTLCIDFNPDQHQKIRKNIIGIHGSAGNWVFPAFGLSFERILKENKTIKLSFGAYPYASFHCNIAYRSYFSALKFGKTIYKNDIYYIRNQQINMPSPKGLYLEAMGFINIHKYSSIFYYEGTKVFGLGVGLGYQFLFFDRLAVNPSLQLPLCYDDEQSNEYNLKPRVLVNLGLGFAF
jgi:hypothetical protein